MILSLLPCFRGILFAVLALCAISPLARANPILIAAFRVDQAYYTNQANLLTSLGAYDAAALATGKAEQYDIAADYLEAGNSVAQLRAIAATWATQAYALSAYFMSYPTYSVLAYAWWGKGVASDEIVART